MENGRAREHGTRKAKNSESMELDAAPGEVGDTTSRGSKRAAVGEPSRGSEANIRLLDQEEQPATRADINEMFKQLHEQVSEASAGAIESMRNDSERAIQTVSRNLEKSIQASIYAYDEIQNRRHAATQGQM